MVVVPQDARLNGNPASGHLIQMSVGIIYGLIPSPAWQHWQHWQHKRKGQHAYASFSGNTRLIPATAKPIIIHFAREISADVICL